MTFAKIDASANPSAVINEFKGINRLPQGSGGEGEFVNLSLDDYPAARSSCMTQKATIYIKTDETAAKLESGKLQYAFEVYEEEGYSYLTGVYDGDFYYRGERIGYADRPDSNFHIKPTDRIEMEKSGTRYIIFAEDENGHSSVWTYNTEGTSMGDELSRKNDGLLQSDMIKDIIPMENTYQSAYLYKLCSPDYASRLNDYEKYTGKSYYMLFPTDVNVLSSALKNERMARYERILKGYNKYTEYSGYYGVTLHIRPKLSEGDFWDEDRYCFDDFFDEHPVRFVVDAAGYDVYNVLLKQETAFFDIVFSDVNTLYPCRPYGISSQNIKTYEEIHPDVDNHTKVTYFPDKTNSTTGFRDTFYGIIGHFESWNEKKQRYEFFGGNRCIYSLVDENGMKKGYGYVKGESAGKEFDISANQTYGHSYTAIEVEFGIMTECTRLNHIAMYQNRAFATAQDGSRLMFSELGKYTSFTDYQGVSTDSGYVDVSSVGKFTGLCEYSGALIAFKRDKLGIYYGSAASEISLSREITGAGCIDSRSICEVGGVLIYLSADGFYSYSGGVPQKISRKLAKAYKSAAAFGSGTKYIADCTDEDGVREILIYDTLLGAWTSMSEPEADVVSCVKNGELCFALSDGTIQTPENTQSGYWKFETMDLFEDMTSDKGINEIYIRARLCGSMEVTTFADDEEHKHMQIIGNGDKVRVWRVPVRFIHKNYYRIRLEGTGSCVLYALERVVYPGGKVK